MGFIKLNPNFFDRPDVLTAGPLAGVVFVCGICYASRNRTGDFIPYEAINEISKDAQIPRIQPIVDSLLRQGLWQSFDGGYRICKHGEAWKHGPFDLRLPWQDWRLIRDRIFKRDDFTCRYCGVRGGALECDHVVPISRGGGNEDQNLVTACFPCNRSKRDKTVQEWMS